MHSLRALIVSTTLSALSLGCGGTLDEGGDLALQDLSLLDAGLSASGSGDSDGAVPAERDAGVQPDPGQRPESKPRFIENIVANGTGCPHGAWEASTSPDEQTVTFTFSAYEAQLTKTRSLEIRECFISLDLRPVEGESFALTEAFAKGYALLDQGVTAVVTMRPYFTAQPLSESEYRSSNLRGNYDDAYEVVDRPNSGVTAWSPCGQPRSLALQTRLQLRRQSGDGEGYVNLAAVDGSMKGRLVLKLARRKCK